MDCILSAVLGAYGLGLLVTAFIKCSEVNVRRAISTLIINTIEDPDEGVPLVAKIQ
jgi:hypothetical protein